MGLGKLRSLFTRRASVRTLMPETDLQQLLDEVGLVSWPQCQSMSRQGKTLQGRGWPGTPVRKPTFTNFSPRTSATQPGGKVKKSEVPTTHLCALLLRLPSGGDGGPYLRFAQVFGGDWPGANLDNR